jgi:hypothetical protein
MTPITEMANCSAFEPTKMLTRPAISEGRGADEKTACDAGAREDEKNTGQRKPHQRGKYPKCHKRTVDAHPVDAKAEEQHHAQRRQHDDPD